MTPKTFHDLGVAAPLADALAEQGITTPFPIQELALPVALQGADIIAQARTGTGKTLGFGLPLLQRTDPETAATQALVVVPTRELCLQVTEDLELGKVIGTSVVAIYGGVGYDTQLDALGAGVTVVVGTPGRLLDHLVKGNLDLSQVSELVLDEADEMLDMGFLPDVERLIDACPSERHTMLFSATMPTPVVKLARRYMAHPTFLRADTEDHEVAPTVEQHFFHVHRMDKPRVLARLLQAPDRGSVYVFVRTKNMVDRLVAELEELGVASIAIHGNLRQATRERNMDRFRGGKVDVLVATEVAARGLDVGNVTHVVNYDCPDDEKMYLHRIGRTARAGGEGVAVTFAEFNEIDRLNMIRRAVDADRDIEEVFSTSDVLAQRFDLPDETPWAHLGQRRERSGAGRRTSSSDGTSKNRRSAERRGDTRSARPRPRRGAEEQGRLRRDETSAQPPATTAATADADADAPPPTGPVPQRAGVRRVRVRNRTSSGTEADAPRRQTPATKPDRTEADGQKGRAAAGGTPGPPTGETGAERSRSRSQRTRDADRTSDDKPQRSREERRSRRSRASSTQRRPAPPREQRPLEPASEQPTPPGEPARGAGQPQRARRVKVEHLP